MRQSALAIETHNGVIGPIDGAAGVKQRPPVSAMTKIVFALVALAAAYVAFQRIGTTANAEVVEFTPNFGGGFLAMGMTEDQPGFVVLSVLDQKEVDVTAAMTINRVAGTHTTVNVRTPHETTSTRLRGPRVILVTEEGSVENHAVDWTRDDFQTLRTATDCSGEEITKLHRCGAPFADLQDVFAEWPATRVPECVLKFLAPFRDPRSHR